MESKKLSLVLILISSICFQQSVNSWLLPIGIPTRPPNVVTLVLTTTQPPTTTTPEQTTSIIKLTTSKYSIWDMFNVDDRIKGVLERVPIVNKVFPESKPTPAGKVEDVPVNDMEPPIKEKVSTGAPEKSKVESVVPTDVSKRRQGLKQLLRSAFRNVPGTAYMCNFISPDGEQHIYSVAGEKPVQKGYEKAKEDLKNKLYSNFKSVYDLKSNVKEILAKASGYNLVNDWLHPMSTATTQAPSGLFGKAKDLLWNLPGANLLHDVKATTPNPTQGYRDWFKGVMDNLPGSKQVQSLAGRVKNIDLFGQYHPKYLPGWVYESMCPAVFSDALKRAVCSKVATEIAYGAACHQLFPKALHEHVCPDNYVVNSMETFFKKFTIGELQKKLPNPIASMKEIASTSFTDLLDKVRSVAPLHNLFAKKNQ